MQTLLRVLDNDKDGKISFQEFLYEFLMKNQKINQRDDSCKVGNLENSNFATSETANYDKFKINNEFKNESPKEAQTEEKKIRFAEDNDKNASSKPKVLIFEEIPSEKTKILLNSDKKKENEGGQKPKKKIMFADENPENPPKKIGFQDLEDNKSNEINEEIADRHRSQSNFHKKNMQDSIDLSSLHPRSKSWDSGRREIETQNKEIDEMFEVLANFHTFRSLKKFIFNL